MNKIIIRKTEELKEWRRNLKSDINFIPTMGNLHHGHQKLISTAQSSNRNTNLLSIFVNPLQFDSKEDLKSYPKTVDKDVEIAFSNGADVIFIPKLTDIYPKKNKSISYLKASKELSSALCGLTRVGHFDGVCTVAVSYTHLTLPTILLV